MEAQEVATISDAATRRDTNDTSSVNVFIRNDGLELQCVSLL